MSFHTGISPFQGEVCRCPHPRGLIPASLPSSKSAVQNFLRHCFSIHIPESPRPCSGIGNDNWYSGRSPDREVLNFYRRKVEGVQLWTTPSVWSLHGNRDVAEIFVSYIISCFTLRSFPSFSMLPSFTTNSTLRPDLNTIMSSTSPRFHW